MANVTTSTNAVSNETLFTHTAVVNTEEQFQQVIALAAKRDLRLACVSNTGLPDGWHRLTFLGRAAFTKDDLAADETITSIDD